MKYFIGQENHFRSLFLHDKFRNENASDYGLSSEKWQVVVDENNNSYALLKDYTQDILFEDNRGQVLKGLDFFKENENIEHINPPENSIIYFDRLLRENPLRQIYGRYGIAWIHELDKIYKERNCTLICNWAYFEATDYECNEMFGLINYKWSCNNIILSDYKFFDNDKYPHLTVDTFYSYWFHLYEHILLHEWNETEIWNNVVHGKSSYFDFINHILDDKPNSDSKKYSFIVGNPGRFHRMYLLKKIIDSDLDKEGDITLKKAMYQDYYDKIQQGTLREGDCVFTNLASKYFSSKYFKPLDFYRRIEDRIGENLNEYNFAHQTHGIKNKEFTNAFLDIYGDTHVMFQTGDKLFSEKVYHGLFYKKNFLIFGSNLFYQRLKEIGGYNFFEEFGINEDEYLKDDNPIRQADIIFNVISKFDKKTIIEIYNKTKEKREKNYKLIFDYYDDLMKPLRKKIIF